MKWVSETHCQEAQEAQIDQTKESEGEYVYVKEEPIDNQDEELIKMTKHVLDQHRKAGRRSGKAGRRSVQRWRSPVPHKHKKPSSPTHKKKRKQRPGRFADLDGKRQPLQVPLHQLRYSQLTAKRPFSVVDRFHN